ncbi:MAG: Filamentation induced by cAMP protein Fic [candidate division TM6 bacterium GW2011_GWF2_37_49]|nr:MAG: Filamentation induced by cAMP protein Fic [candidate division TM6 bacterium GW2011_GWF2_37_49]
MYSNKIKDIDELQNQINFYRPFKKKFVDNLKEYFRIGLTYTSNAMEGNSLTETETKIILEDGLTVAGKPVRDHLEALGHSQAYDLLYKLAKNNEIKEQDILKLHKLFYYHIDIKNAGKYRKQQVFITGTEFVPPAPKLVPELMKKLINSMILMRQELHPIEFAAVLHKELVSIHPFVDGNGRAARLIMNLALLQQSYVVTIIPPILRTDYISLLKRAQVEPKDDKPFINFISTMVYESQKDYLRMIRSFYEK